MEDYKQFVENLQNELPTIKQSFTLEEFVVWVQNIIKQFGGKPPVQEDPISATSAKR